MSTAVVTGGGNGLGAELCRQLAARDPDAWPSWSGAMMQPGEVAEVAMRVLDRPRIVRVHQRWRGVLRLGAAFPGTVAPLLPAIVRDARRKQRKFAEREGL